MRHRLLALLLIIVPAAARADKTADLVQSQFEQGRAAFHLGEYDEAIAHFREAYRLRPDPAYLYDLGLAYGKKGDYEKARFFYQQYLPSTPRDSDARRDVQAKIADATEAIAAAKAASTKPPQTPEAPPAERAAAPPPIPLPVATAPAPIVTPSPEAPPAPRRWPWIAGGVSAGTGALLVAAGVVLRMRAADAFASVEDARQSGQPWSDALAATQDGGRRDATLGAVAIGVGAAALVGGGILFYVGARSHSERARLVPTASARSFGVALEGSF